MDSFKTDFQKPKPQVPITKVPIEPFILKRTHVTPQSPIIHPYNPNTYKPFVSAQSSLPQYGG